MNQQIAASAPVFNGAPEWLTLPFVLIGIGVLVVLLALWWGTRLARRRRNARDEVADYNAEQSEPVAPARPIIPPPVMPAPPPIVEAPLAPPPPEPEAPMPEAAASVPAEAEPAIDEAPEPAPFADEPIAAAAPLDASPASIAADIPPPAAEPPAEVPPLPPAPAADELTRMKGVGPRLAQRLNDLGVTSFAQIAALTPEETDALDAQLGDFQGRIHRDRWIEQARFLAHGDTAGFEEAFGKL